MMNAVHTIDSDLIRELSSDLMNNLYDDQIRKLTEQQTPLCEQLLDCIFIQENEKTLARIALMRNDNVSFQYKKPILAGFYECVNDSKVAAFLFDEMNITIKNTDYDFVIGPMNGNTWNTYRFADDWSKPVFFSEKFHHHWYSRQWKENGFREIASYYSSQQDDLTIDNDFLQNKTIDLQRRGIVIRQLNMNNYEMDLSRVFSLCEKAFSGNPFYTSISLSEFLSKYGEIKKFIDPSIVLIAEKEDRIAGFIFCLHNLYDPGRKGIIIKTLARDESDPLTKGLGTVLSSMIMKHAAENNAGYLLHAFMYNLNNSTHLSDVFHSKVIRNYHLFGKDF